MPDCWIPSADIASFFSDSFSMAVDNILDLFVFWLSQNDYDTSFVCCECVCCVANIWHSGNILVDKQMFDRRTSQFVMSIILCEQWTVCTLYTVHRMHRDN